MLMQLRKICNHPFVFEDVERAISPESSINDLLWRSAGKFELLDRLLPKFFVTGHRVRPSPFLHACCVTNFLLGPYVLSNDPNHEHHGGLLSLPWMEVHASRRIHKS